MTPMTTARSTKAINDTVRSSILILALLAFGLPSPAQGQTYTLAPAPFQTFLDNSGNIVNGGCVRTMLTGTTTDTATYTTSSGTLNANPIIAGSDGRFVAYLVPGTVYRFRYENIPCSAATPGATIRTVDGIAAVPVSGLNVDVTGTAGETLSLADLVYLSGTDGSWYRADADATASSTTAVAVGFATAAAASAATVTVRTAGRMTGLSLTAGEIYYVSATAAALAATPPTNARCVGKADSTTTLILPCELGDVRLADSDGTHSLVVRTSSDLTADRLLTIVTGDAAQTLTFPTIQIQTITSTGTQNDLTVTAARYLLLRCNNASLLTITGFTAGTDGDMIDVVSIGAGIVEFDDQAGSVAANQLINFASSGMTPLAAGDGTARFVYDGTTARWRMVEHNQGAWITRAYAAGNFAGNGGTWGVDSGDITTDAFYLVGRTMTYAGTFATTDVGAGSTSLDVTIPSGMTATLSVIGYCITQDAGGAARQAGYILITGGGTLVGYRREATAGFTSTAGDNTNAEGSVTFQVN